MSYTTNFGPYEANAVFISEQQSIRPRRPSALAQSSFGGGIYDSPTSYRPQYQNPFAHSNSASQRAIAAEDASDEDDDTVPNETLPLLSASARSKSSGPGVGYGAYSDSKPKQPSRHNSYQQRSPSSSSSRSRKKKTIFDRQGSQFPPHNDEYNVNYPPSVPGSPRIDPANPDMNFGDVMVRDDYDTRHRSGDDVNKHADNASTGSSPRRESGFEVGYDGRRHTIAIQAEEDVCFPVEMSELAEEDQREEGRRPGQRRRRSRWPDLSVLDEWSRFEKEGRNEERRAKKITEPQLINGRLRVTHRNWHRAEDDAPYRFTYFNEEFQSTIHSQTISELVQTGGNFRELFIPDPPELSDSSESEEDDLDITVESSYLHHVTGINGESKPPTRHSSLIGPAQNRPDSRRSIGRTEQVPSNKTSGEATPNNGVKSPSPRRASPELVNDSSEKTEKAEKPKRYGERPTWWLDVLSPTDAEMKTLSKAFGIHPLTAEDIMMQEAREKVELFRNYYFVNYRTFEQDMNNEDFLEPVNMYVVVFREGVISFHFSMTPHPANVRRRIRQLKDYLILSSDWISYAIIDDITDVFAPLIQSIEDEVDDIDDAILKLHSPPRDEKSKKDNEKRSEFGDGTSGESGGDMLRRVGDCRKKVMGLYRLLGNKADVIKGFAKRCNERWEVAPRSEIGLYLGDIQDHIVTMTGNLSHYEK